MGIDQPREIFVRDGWQVWHLSEPDDLPIVAGLWLACADYILLVTGEAPKPTEAQAFFAAVPPDHARSSVLKLGIARQHEPWSALLGIVDVCRGYPDANTWYIGLLLLHPAARGGGAGRAVVEGLTEAARDERVVRLMLSVLEENTAALKFWRAMGFEHSRTLPARRFGSKDHVLLEFVRPL